MDNTHYTLDSVHRSPRNPFVVYASLYDDTGRLAINASLGYIVNAAKERNYTIVVSPNTIEDIVRCTKESVSHRQERA